MTGIMLSFQEVETPEDAEAVEDCLDEDEEADEDAADEEEADGDAAAEDDDNLSCNYDDEVAVLERSDSDSSMYDAPSPTMLDSLSPDRY